MKIICATSIPFAKEAFGPLGDLQILPPSEITRGTVRDADILIARSTLKINAALLEGSRVKFVYTCTIGTDHMDLDYLDGAKINWGSAAGCNANSVAEYVTSALLCLARRHQFGLRGKSIAIIGAGNVGSLVVKKAEALGMRALLNDPPLRDSTGDKIYLPLEEVLPAADIVTMHVPLTKDGKYPTFHMAGKEFFGRVKPGCIFINAARGAVLDSDLFLKVRRDGTVSRAVIDCWEGEPAFRLDVMKAAHIATPHIAGYSFEGKVKGTVMAYRQLCHFLKTTPTWQAEPLMPPPPVPEITLDASGMPDEAALADIVKRVYDVETDDSLLRASACADPAGRGKNFELMRRNYRMRREFRYTRVVLRNGTASLSESLRKLEFQVVEK